MTRALGRFALLLLFHLFLVGSGFACADPSMQAMPDMPGMPGHSSRHHAPTPSQTCTAPASCVPSMTPVSKVAAAVPTPTRSIAAAAGMRAPALDPAAPDTPPPRV